MNLDIFAFLTMNTPNLLDELITLRTDEHNSKRQVINDIVFNGKANLPSKKETSETLNVISTFMLALGLSIT